MKEYTIVIRNGKAQFVYSDDLAPVSDAMGRASVTRASHVEPHPTKPGWIADMSPAAGTDIVLGKNGSWFLGASGWELIEPFALRQQALDAERDWLREHRGL